MRVAAPEVISAQDGVASLEPEDRDRAGIPDGGRRAEELPGAETDLEREPGVAFNAPQRHSRTDGRGGSGSDPDDGQLAGGRSPPAASPP